MFFQFISKCQAEILRCAPPSSHVVIFLVFSEFWFFVFVVCVYVGGGGGEAWEEGGWPISQASSLGWWTANFATTPEDSRDEFAVAYNPPILRNITESKMLSQSRNKLVIGAAVKQVCFLHVFPCYSSAIVDNFAFYRAL